MDTPSSNHDAAQAIALAARLTHCISGLPGVGTQDWSERAAAAIAQATSARWVAVALSVTPVPPRLPVLLVGVSAHSPPGARLMSMEDDLRNPGSAVWARAREGDGDGGLWDQGPQSAQERVPLWRSHQVRLPTHFVRAIVSGEALSAHPDFHAALLQLAAAEVAGKAGGAFRPNPAGEVPILTEKECQVVELLSLGLRPVDVGVKMHRSKHTVHEHSKAAHAKIGVDSRARLIARYFGRPSAD